MQKITKIATLPLKCVMSGGATSCFLLISVFQSQNFCSIDHLKPIAAEERRVEEEEKKIREENERIAKELAEGRRLNLFNILYTLYMEAYCVNSI